MMVSSTESPRNSRRSLSGRSGRHIGNGAAVAQGLAVKGRSPGVRCRVFRHQARTLRSSGVPGRMNRERIGVDRAACGRWPGVVAPNPKVLLRAAFTVRFTGAVEGEVQLRVDLRIVREVVDRRRHRVMVHSHDARHRLNGSGRTQRSVRSCWRS